MTNIEYWLLKKTLGTWTKVSWWDESEHDKAMRSYESMVKSGGYAMRLAKVEIVNEQLLDEMLPEPPSTEVLEATKQAKDEVIATTGWGSMPTTSWGQHQEVNGGVNPVALGVKEPWSTAKEEAAHVRLNGHGMSGKVWLGNPTTKEKKRVAPDEVAGMMAAGWIKAGPRTVL